MKNLVTQICFIIICIVLITGCCPTSKYEDCINDCEESSRQALEDYNRCLDAANDEREEDMLACDTIPLLQLRRLCKERAEEEYDRQVAQCRTTLNTVQLSLKGCSFKCLNSENKNEPKPSN